MRVAIIPARGGSQRIPRKNLRLFHGKPILAYSIETAQRSQLFDRIVVSTDDDDISAAAIAYGAEVIRRPADFADAITGTQAVTKHALEAMGAMNDWIACCIYATAPLMSVHDLERGMYPVSWPERSRHVYAFSVGTEPLQDAGQFYWGRAEAFLKEFQLLEEWSAMIPIIPERVCDINTEEDWVRAERMYAALHPGIIIERNKNDEVAAELNMRHDQMLNARGGI